MEGGYAGGDDSPYAKAKAADEAKLLERKKKAEARKKRGFTELKDAKKRTFAETKYDYDELPEKEDPFKKFFGKGFGTFNK